MGLGPRAPIIGPLAEPPRVGLIAQARVIDDDNQSRWWNSFSFEPENCGANRGIQDPCDANETKSLTGSEDIVTIEPYVIWAGDRCSSFGWNARDYEARARRLLLACQSAQVEDEFWTGTKSTAEGWGNQHLANSATADVVTPGAAQSPQLALRCLEQYLAECACGARGMIHATRQMVSAWSENGLVRREGGQILTINDTIVVSGAGYDGSSPDGEPAASGSVWAYATSIVTVRLSPIIVNPERIDDALDRTANTIEYRAERLAAAYWDGCCHGAARVNLELCAIGGS